MKIVSASDLHLEFNLRKPNLGVSDSILLNESDADVLILAGDIFSSRALKDRDSLSKVQEVLRIIDASYANIIYVMGNHEHYHGDFFLTKNLITECFSVLNNFTFLEKTGVNINGIRFFGGTMWTDLSDPIHRMAANIGMNDYQVIKNSAKQVSFKTLDENGAPRFHRRDGTLTSADTTQDYFSFLEELRVDLANHPTTDYVVVTHHSPSMAMCDSLFFGDKMNVCYHNNLDNFIMDTPRIKRWYCGHTHMPKRVTMGDCEIILNPKGYPGERKEEYCLAETIL